MLSIGQLLGGPAGAQRSDDGVMDSKAHVMQAGHAHPAANAPADVMRSAQHQAQLDAMAEQAQVPAEFIDSSCLALTRQAAECRQLQLRVQA